MLGKLVGKNAPLYIRGGQGKGYLVFKNEDLDIELPLPFPVRGEGKLLLVNGAAPILRAWSRKGAELHLGDGEISISLGKGRAFLRAEKAEDYPLFPGGRGPLVCPLALSKGLEVAARAALPQEKGEVSFVLLETAQEEEGSVLRILGTNPYRIARYELPLSTALLPVRGGFLSPKTALGLVPILRRLRDALEVVPCEEGLLLKGGGLKLLVRGQRDLHPDYWRGVYRIIFREYSPVAKLEVGPLQEALRRIKGFLKAQPRWERRESVFLSLRGETLEVKGDGWREVLPASPLSEEGLEGEFGLDGLLSILPPGGGRLVLEADEPVVSLREEGYQGVMVYKPVK